MSGGHIEAHLGCCLLHNVTVKRTTDNVGIPEEDGSFLIGLAGKI